MAEIDVNTVMQGLLGDEDAQAVQQRLLGGQQQPQGINVGSVPAQPLSLGVADVRTPAGAPEDGEVDAGLPTPRDPSAQFLSPEEFDFLLRQEPQGPQAAGLSQLQQEAQLTRGFDPRQRAQDRFNEMLLQEAAPTVPAARTLGNIGASFIAPAAGTAGGAVLGARLISRFFPQAARAVGVARLAGASAGSTAGTELNQTFGLEADSDFNTVVAALTPGAGAAVSRFGKKFLAATGAGRTTRAATSGDILEGTVARVGAPNVERELQRKLPELISDRSALPALVNDTFNRVRAPGNQIDLGDTIRAWQNLRPREQSQIIAAVRNADPELAVKLRTAMDARPLPVPVGQAPSTQPMVFDGEELIRMREGLSDTRFALKTESGATQAAAKRERRELGQAIKIFEETTERSPLGAEHLTAVRLKRIQASMEELSDHIQSLSTPRLQGQFSGKEFNIGKLINDVDDARDALKQGKKHKLSEIANLLEHPQAYKEWKSSMTRLKRLAVGNNIQVFSQAFGPVTRAAQLAGDVVGAKAMGEILVSPMGRALLERVLKINGGGVSAPILSTLLSASRAMTLGQMDTVDREVVNLMGQVKDAAMPQLGASARQQIPEPGQRQQPQLSAPPPRATSFR